MKKSIKYTLLLLAVFPLLVGGCESLFDKGDTEKVYTGPDVVAFKPLTTEVDEGESASIDIQFISNKGLSPNDVSVGFSVDGSSTAQDGVHYNITTSSPVTIAAGTAVTTISIDIIADSGLDAGDEVTLILNLDGGEGVEVAEELDTSTIYIGGVDDTP